jgi:hypothetical protein
MSFLAKYWRRRRGDVRRMNDASEKATATTPKEARCVFDATARVIGGEPRVTNPDKAF